MNGAGKKAGGNKVGVTGIKVGKAKVSNVVRDASMKKLQLQAKRIRQV